MLIVILLLRLTHLSIALETHFDRFEKEVLNHYLKEPVAPGYLVTDHYFSRDEASANKYILVITGARSEEVAPTSCPIIEVLTECPFDHFKINVIYSSTPLIRGVKCDRKLAVYESEDTSGDESSIGSTIGSSNGLSDIDPLAPWL